MPTVKEILTAVREYCGNPAHEFLNNATICLHLYDEIDDLLNRLNLTESNWILDRQTISVHADETEYQLNANFGRSVVVETLDESFTDRRREIQTIDYQDFNLYWNGYNTSYLYAGYTHTAEVCCFFKLQDQFETYIKFAPPPSEPCDYRVWYEIGRQVPPKLSEKPKVMEQFHNLLKVKTAKSCLPHCFKGGEEDEPKFARHWAMLSEKEARFDQTFETYIQQGYQEDTGPRRGFNSSRSGWEGW